MLTLVLAVAAALVISAVCSLTETMLYSVSWAHIEELRKKGKLSGELLFQMRSQVEKPIAAVLTLNTVANTAGSAVAGAAFSTVFDSVYMGVFAAIFTCLILIFGEIIPKTLGVLYANPVSTVLARPLFGITKLLTPIIWLSSCITRLFSPASDGPQMSEDDIRAVTSLSRKAGMIQPYAENTIRNVLSLERKRVWDIMTPRTVVFSLEADLDLKEACTQPDIWHFSRIPIFADNNEDIVGLVERRTLAKYLAHGQECKGKDCTLGDIMIPVQFVQESLTLDKLLQNFLNSRMHLCVVLDEYGGLAGVVSLEDVLEEILGREIVDESDAVADLQELARARRKAATQKS